MGERGREPVQKSASRKQSAPASLAVMTDTPSPLPQPSAAMQRSLALAAQAVGLSNPNPAVGCVLIASDGQLIGQGHTQAVGGPHAEVMALRDAAEQRGHQIGKGFAHARARLHRQRATLLDRLAHGQRHRRLPLAGFEARVGLRQRAAIGKGTQRIKSSLPSLLCKGKAKSIRTYEKA